MSELLFAQLERVILPDESLNFKIFRQTNGLLVLMQPRLNEPQEELPTHIQQTRAALAIPTRLLGSAAELDADFATRLQGIATARREVYDGYQAQLDALREAAKEAKTSTPSTTKTAATKSHVAKASTLPASTTNARAEETPPAATNPASEAPAARADTGVMQPASLF